MPSTKYLSWFEITDFTKGLWNERAGLNLVAPADSFQTMTDIMPLKSGGARAFYKSTSRGNTNIAANQFACGLFKRNGVPLRSGAASDSFDAFVMTISSVDFKARCYRMDGSNGETTWKLVGTGQFDTPAATGTGHQVTGFAYFKETAGNEFYIVSLAAGGNSGLFKIAYVGGAGPPAGDGVTTKIAAYSGPVAVSQARILVGTGNDEKIHYSDVGATTITTPSSQVVSITPNQFEPNVSIIMPTEPADLLIGKEGGAWVEVNGDITSTSTPIRELNKGHYQRQNKQQACKMPDGGIAFIEGEGRIWQTDGRTFTSLSDQIPRFDEHGLNAGLVGPGQMDVLNGLLFAPKGYVYDTENKCWFQSSVLANTLYHCADPYEGDVWSVETGSGFDIKMTSIFEGSTNTNKRVSSWTLQTQPLSSPDGRLVEIREVQVFVQCYTTSTITAQAIDSSGNVVSTQTNAAVTGRDGVRLLFPNCQDQYMSINITASANNGTSEAPTVERIRVGMGAGNLIR